MYFKDYLLGIPYVGCITPQTFGPIIMLNPDTRTPPSICKGSKSVRGGPHLPTQPNGYKPLV